MTFNVIRSHIFKDNVNIAVLLLDTINISYYKIHKSWLICMYQVEALSVGVRNLMKFLS